MCGTGLTSEQMVQLQTEFPAVKFVWYVQIGAWQVRTDIESFTTENRKTFPDGAMVPPAPADAAMTRSVAKTALAYRSGLTVSVVAAAEPETSPLHPTNRLPAFGEAVSVTLVPAT